MLQLHQIEKGPVDYITGNARYALHEKNLLSKITEFHKLNVMVYLEDDPYLKDTPYTPLKSCQVSWEGLEQYFTDPFKYVIDQLFTPAPLMTPHNLPFLPSSPLLPGIPALLRHHLPNQS